MNTLGQDQATARVELGEDVVEQEQGRESAALGDQLCLREEQSQDRQALFTLRAEAAQVARTARQDNVVEMGADPGRAAVEIANEVWAK